MGLFSLAGCLLGGWAADRFGRWAAAVADRRFGGTALSAQTATGFALTVAGIQLVPLLADAAGWQYAFLLLTPGHALRALAMRRAGARSSLGAGSPSTAPGLA